MPAQTIHLHMINFILYFPRPETASALLDNQAKAWEGRSSIGGINGADARESCVGVQVTEPYNRRGKDTCPQK